MPGNISNFDGWVGVVVVGVRCGVGGVGVVWWGGGGWVGGGSHLPALGLAATGIGWHALRSCHSTAQRAVLQG